MMKAAEAMIGGMNCPPVEPTASTAPAKCGGKPVRFINGMVKVPTAATLATALPLIMPNRDEPATATFAGPPRTRPNRP